MPSERSSAGDPARTLELLWRQPGHRGSGRGPKQALSVDEVVNVGIRLADELGLEAVTMRRVAQALDVAPMSLYTYVPGKSELLELMLDAVYSQMPRTPFDGKPWPARVEAIARENRTMYEAHPWVSSLTPLRPPLGPGMMAKYEHELRALDGVGLDDVEMDVALTYVLSFVQSTARAAADASHSQIESSMSDEQWWAANEPLLARVFDEKAYPTAARVGSAASASLGGVYNAEVVFEFGLQRVLDGLGVLIDARSAQQAGAAAGDGFHGDRRGRRARRVT